MDKDTDILADTLNFLRKFPREFSVRVFSAARCQYPGFLSGIHCDTKSVYPTCFKGVQFEASKELFDKLKAVQRYHVQKEWYKWHKPYNNYIQHEMEPVKKIDVYASEIDLAGNIDLTVQHTFSPEEEAVFNAKVKELREVDCNISLNYLGSNFSSIFMISVPQMNITSSSLLVQYLQTITPQLALGTELSLKGDGRNTVDLNSASISGRFNNDDHTFSTTISSKGAQFCFYKLSSPYLKVASILDVEFETRKTIASIAYQFDWMGLKLKMCFDTELNTGINLEKFIKLSRDEFKHERGWLKIVLSAVMKNNKDFYLGIGLQTHF